MDPFQYYRHLRHTKRYVDSHLSEPLRLIDVAREVGLTPAYYSAYFHRTAGIRFCDWLSRRRIDLAKKMLCECDRPIYQIAEDSGFGSLSTFERIFKKNEQVSPSTYRKMNARVESKHLPNTS